MKKKIPAILYCLAIAACIFSVVRLAMLGDEAEQIAKGIAERNNVRAEDIIVQRHGFGCWNESGTTEIEYTEAEWNQMSANRTKAAYAGLAGIGGVVMLVAGLKIADSVESKGS